MTSVMILSPVSSRALARIRVPARPDRGTRRAMCGLVGTPPQQHWHLRPARPAPIRVSSSSDSTEQGGDDGDLVAPISRRRLDDGLLRVEIPAAACTSWKPGRPARRLA
jgi:hypothetical protein